VRVDVGIAFGKHDEKATFSEKLDRIPEGDTLIATRVDPSSWSITA
jgi:hypothetical protein